MSVSLTVCRFAPLRLYLRRYSARAASPAIGSAAFEFASSFSVLFCVFAVFFIPFVFVSEAEIALLVSAE